MKILFGEFRFLPNYFKKIGFIALITTSLAMFISKNYMENLIALKELSSSIILISLFIIMISKEKTEDELITKIRTMAFTFSFLIGIVSVAVSPIIDYLFEGNFINEMSTTKVFFQMIFTYFLVFYLLKFRR